MLTIAGKLLDLVNLVHVVNSINRVDTVYLYYPLVNQQFAMENHHVEWVNQRISIGYVPVRKAFV